MGARELDYVKLGKRIRAARKNLGMKQADLAFDVDVTTTHLSHVETANTKVALPTIVKIANALSVSVDDLLYDSLESVKPVYDKKIAEELEDCNAVELEACYEVIRITKNAIRNNHKD